MTPDQLSAVCASFEKVLASTPDLGMRFYRRLSSDHPDIARIFHSVKMEAQHTRFISMLHIILLRMKECRPVEGLMGDLGDRHRRFGVTEDSFKKFGATLMAVLEESLAEEFDSHLHAAWIEMYREIARLMDSAGEASISEPV